LKLARVAAGLTQRELAEAAEVSQSMVAKIEAGNSRRPQLEILVRLAKALELPEDLFIEKDKLQEQQDAESLEGMLVRCGVSKEAAGIIVRSLRQSARSELKSALEKNEKGRR
jgi:transcriptional regulator with XRE-family HTH domain